MHMDKKKVQHEVNGVASFIIFQIVGAIKKKTSTKSYLCNPANVSLAEIVKPSLVAG